MAILNSNDYVILYSIRDSKNNLGLCEGRGMSKKVIAERSKLSLSTVTRSVAKLLESGFISEAIKQVNTNAYYINEKGKARLSEVYKVGGVNNG